jgi:arylsulfatase I/J
VGYFHADESYSHGEKAFPDGVVYSQATTTDEADEKNRFGGPPHDMWHGDHAGIDVTPDIFYSTNYYSDRAVSFINQHNGSTTPLFIHLPYQCCHSPYGEVPVWERMQPPSTMWNPVYADMLHVLDSGLANVTAAWKAAGMWDNLLMIVSSDNGGSTTSHTANNYPLRGEKTMPFDGGMRVAAFISGGFVPPALRGTTNSHTFMHVADWYPTLCGLAGADPTDNVKGADGVVRGIDGKDQWAQLTHGSMVQPHDYIPLMEETIIQPSTGWKLVRGGASWWWDTNGSHAAGALPAACKTPCLFNITADPGERIDMSAANPDIVKALTKQSKSYEQIYEQYAYNRSLYEPMPNHSSRHDSGLNNFTGYFTPCFRRVASGSA